MSRRARAAAFLGLALTAAALAAGIANGYGARVARGYGALRSVVVVGTGLRAGRRIGPAQLSSALEVRRVPRRFVPAGALSSPGEALGLVPQAPMPAGSYLLGAQLRAPRRPALRQSGLAARFRPVQIAVSGAGALLAAGPLEPGTRVDVVVTLESGNGAQGRAYVAASGVPLLSLEPAADDTGPGGLALATVGLTRRQALRLIAAGSFARQMTLLPGS